MTGFLLRPEAPAPLAFDTLRDMAVHVWELAAGRDICTCPARVGVTLKDGGQAEHVAVLVRATARHGGHTIAYVVLDDDAPEHRADRFHSELMAVIRDPTDPLGLVSEAGARFAPKDPQRQGRAA